MPVAWMTWFSCKGKKEKRNCGMFVLSTLIIIYRMWIVLKLQRELFTKQVLDLMNFWVCSHSFFLVPCLCLPFSLTEKKMYTFSSPWLSHPSLSSIFYQPHFFLTMLKTSMVIFGTEIVLKAEDKFCIIIPGFWSSLH